MGSTEIYYRPPETGIAEAEIQVQGAATNDQTVTVDGVNFDIKQDLFIGYEIVQDIDTPNNMGMMFELDVPGTLIPDRAVILQYAQYRKSDNYYDDWVGVACVKQVGVQGSQKVFNFRGQGILDGYDDTGNAEPWDAQKPADFVAQDPRDGSEFYRVRLDDQAAYELDAFGGSKAGNKLQRCVAQLEFPKEDFNQEWFGNYTVYVGARIYKRPSEAAFISIPEDSMQLNFDPPVYDDTIKENIESSFKEQVQNFLDLSTDVDTSAVCGAGATAPIRVIGDLELNPDINADQKVTFRMEAGVDNACYPSVEGKILAGYFSLVEEISDPNGEPTILNVVCRTTIGNAFAHSSSEYPTTADLSVDNLLDTTTAIPKTEQAFVDSPDYTAYETYDDGSFTYVGCTVEYKFNMAEELGLARRLQETGGNVFDVVYFINGGAKIYDDKTSTVGSELATFSDMLYLPVPEYD